MDISTKDGALGGGGPPKKQLLAEESHPIFREGIYLILSRWSALQLALENEWGGRGSHSLADQFASSIFSWFTSTKEPLYIDDLENILDEGMLNLNTMIEDGSIEEVAEKLMIMHEECLEGNYGSIEKLREAGLRSVAQQCVRQPGDDEEDEEDEDDDMGDDRTQMKVDVSGFQLKSDPVSMHVDETTAKEAQTDDGWEVVSSRRNKGKKN